VYAGANDPLVLALKAGLRDRGYIEGRTIHVEHRFADGKIDRIPELVEELARLNASIFIAGAEPIARIQMRISPQTPIVLVAMGFDPLASGMIDSLSRPGGRITGIYARTGDAVSKAVELLKELKPAIEGVAAFYDSWGHTELTVIEASARALGVRLVPVKLAEPYAYAAAFRNAKKTRAEAGIMTFSARFYGDKDKIAHAALAESFPTISFDRSYVKAGGLLSYGPPMTETWARSAYFIDRILKGERPGDLPMEEPRAFKIAVNARTAEALNIEIPESISIRADEVIK
jgi:putative ABC transport system substrate-binding protein